MSSKIEVTFLDGDEMPPVTRKFTVRHFRNYMKTGTGKVEPSPNGGYTVLATEQGELYVAKCNPVYDKFSRSAGLKEVLNKYVERCYRGFKILRLENTTLNAFNVVIEENFADS
jgi:hypothetical protein